MSDLSDGDFSYESIAALAITSKNYHLPVQGVSVEYLPENQKLQIPAAMGMSWSPTTDHTNLCETNHTLYSRFWKVASMSYADIETLVKTKISASAIREAVDGLEMITPVSERPKWWEESTNDETFGNLSKILQLNCDIRDFGYLLTENATVTDSAWSNNVENVPRIRLQNKLKPYSLRMIAALNYGPVGNNPLGGWIRAYGLGIGIYPTQDSAFKFEAVYTTEMPSLNDEIAVLEFEESYGENLENLCSNVLAVFGLFHLSKDKTFVRGDEYMNRTANSYLKTLEIPDTMISMMKHKECLLRIAPHPFGLAQTYWLAKVMYKHQLLMPSLAIPRFVYTTPPPVQRIMVILEAVREWENLPAAREVLEMFSDKIDCLKTQQVAIKENPPWFSDLYRFYGCEEKMKISEKIWDDVKTLMPATYGFAMVVHVSEDGKKKDGIAMARCLMSVERDMKRGGIFWKDLWRKMLQSSSK